MTQRQTHESENLQYYATAAYPCSYLEGHIARSQVAVTSDAIADLQYSKLIQHGFRRSGLFIYRPYCDHCQACTSIRLPVADFKPNKSQKRAWARHGVLKPTVIEPGFLDEHYALYLRYQKARHLGGGMDQDDAAQYTEFMVKTNVDSCTVEFRQPSVDHVNGELKMVSIIDRLEDGLSAVYTFYAPEPQQNYGTFNVLWQIQHAQSLGLNYLYLGYWIANCKKMSYKVRFTPHELFSEGRWTTSCV